MSKKTSLALITFVLIAAIFTSDIHAQMPDTTPRMPADIINSVFGALPRMPRDLINSVLGVLPKMPDTTPVMPDILGFLANMLPSGIRKFLAPPSPDINLPYQLGQWQEEPTKKPTPTPTLPPGAKIQVGPYKYTPTDEAKKVGIPSFTISAPSGWASYSTSGTELARFESQEVDTEVVKDGEVTTNAVINLKVSGDYSDLNDFVSQYQASGKSVKGYQQKVSSKQSVAGLDGQQLEFIYQKKVDQAEITVHELDYLTFKDGVSYLLKGYASDASWSQHSGEIRSALDSFKFK